MACSHPQAERQLRDRHRRTGLVGATRAIAPPLAQGRRGARADAELRQQLALAEQQLADLKTALDDMRAQRDAWQTMAQARIRPLPEVGHVTMAVAALGRMMAGLSVRRWRAGMRIVRLSRFHSC